MASTIKQRLRRYNGTDYDTIHLENHANNVLVDVSAGETDTLDHVLSTIGGATDARTGEPLKLYSIPSDYAMIETVGTLPTFSSGNSPTSIIQYKDEAYALYVTFTNTTMSMELQKINMNTLNSYTGKLFTGSASSSQSQGSSNIFYYYMGCGVIGLAYRTNSTGALTYLSYDCKYTNTTGSMISFPNFSYSYSGTYYTTFATDNYIVEIDTFTTSPSHTIKYHNRAASTSRSSPNFTTFTFTLSDSRNGKSSYSAPQHIVGTNGDTLYFCYTTYGSSYNPTGFAVFSYTIGSNSIVELYRNTDNSIYLYNITVLPWDQSKCTYCWYRMISSGVYEYHQELRTLPGFEPVSGSASIVYSSSAGIQYPWYSDTAYDYYIIPSSGTNCNIYQYEKGTLNLVGTRLFKGVDTTVYSKPTRMATYAGNVGYDVTRPQFSYDTRYGMYPFPNYVYTSNHTANIKTATTLPGVAYMAYDDSPMPRSGYFYGLANGRQLQRTQWDKYVVGSVTAL